MAFLFRSDPQKDRQGFQGRPSNPSPLQKERGHVSRGDSMRSAQGMFLSRSQENGSVKRPPLSPRRRAQLRLGRSPVPLVAWACLQKRLHETPKLPPKPETQNSTLRVTSTLLQKISRRSDLASRWPSSSAQTLRRIGKVSKVDPPIIRLCGSSYSTPSNNTT